MPIEYKAAPTFMMGIDGRTVTGIAAVHGNIDEGGDRSYPGLFGDFTVNGRSRARFLWQHDSSQPPIATIDRAFDVSRADLPPAVLQYAPEATGGTAITRTYLEDAFAERVFGGIKSSAITEMSYAYEPKDWKFTEDGDRPVRELYKAEVFDWSDVNWGMNPATSADGQKGAPLYVERQTVHAAVESYIKRLEALYALRVVKEGRRFSSATVQEIESAIAELRKGNKAADDAIGRLEKLITPIESDDGKAIRRLALDFQRTLATLNGVT
jgi:hypothetical protein